MPGLLRGIARTAVVAGTATAVSNRVSRRQAGRWAAKEAEDQQTSAPRTAGTEQGYAEPAPASAGTTDVLAQLKQLGDLRDSGVLTEDEFQQQKSRILGG